MPLVADVEYYPVRRIYLSADSVGVDLDTLDVYREVRALRRTNEAHRKFRPMIIAGGNITKIPGVSATPAYAQLLYGCRIVPYNVSHALRLIRDTFSDDGLAGRDCFDRTPLSASVAVDIDVDIKEVEIRFIATGGTTLLADERAKLMGLSAAPAIANDVWTAAERTLTAGGGSGGISPEQYDALLAAINSRSTLGLTDVLAQQAGGSAVVTEILTADVQTNAPLTGG